MSLIARTNADVAETDALRRKIRKLENASVGAQMALLEATVALAAFVTIPEPKIAQLAIDAAAACEAAMKELQEIK